MKIKLRAGQNFIVDPLANDFTGWGFAESRYSHRNTLGLGNYRGDPFVTGCDRRPDCYAKTEIMTRMAHGVGDREYFTRWYADAPDYPFDFDSRSVQFFYATELSIKKYFRGVYHYSTTYTSDAVFIIGGAHTGNIVAEFKDDRWRRLRDLRQPRSRHGSIMMGTQTIIFGGVRFYGRDTEEDSREEPRPIDTIETEVWDFEAGQSETIAPMLSQEQYSQGIALYFVDEANFCVEESDLRRGVPT